MPLLEVDCAVCYMRMDWGPVGLWLDHDFAAMKAMAGTTLSSLGSLQGCHHLLSWYS